MPQNLTPQQMVIWTVNAKPREQILMLRILETYRRKQFTATINEIAELSHMSIGSTVRTLNGLRDLGWLDSSRMYKKTGRNLPVVSNCEYVITIVDKKEEDLESKPSF
jgi:hypothetical protein